MVCFKKLKTENEYKKDFEVYSQVFLTSISCENMHYLLIKNRVGQHFLYEIPKLRFAFDMSGLEEDTKTEIQKRIAEENKDLQSLLENLSLDYEDNENIRYYGHKQGKVISSLGPIMFSESSAWEGPGSTYGRKISDEEINEGRLNIVLFTGNCEFYVGHRSDFEDFGVAPTQLKEIFKLLYESLKSGKSLDLSAKK